MQEFPPPCADPPRLCGPLVTLRKQLQQQQLEEAKQQVGTASGEGFSACPLCAMHRSCMSS